jgi:hypothetical protein
MKIRPVGAELFHADGQTNRQTDKTKLIVSFRNFAKAPKKYSPNSQEVVTEPSRVTAQHNTACHHFTSTVYISRCYKLYQIKHLKAAKLGL